MYVNEFSDLIDLSGYSDSLAIVIKFRRGLNASTQDRIAESGTDRPADNDPNGWYKAARCFNLNRLANEAFHTLSIKRSAPALHAPDGRTAYAFPRMSTPTQYVKPAPTSAFPPLSALLPHFTQVSPWTLTLSAQSQPHHTLVTAVAAPTT
jgi:hypothetical protein